MPELKRNFTKGRINKDLDERMVPNGEYRDALNIEVATSEGSNVGTVQTLKGNTKIQLPSSYNLGDNATCVGTITKDNTNKLYWLVSAPDKNTAASKTQSFVTQGGDSGDGGTIDIVHNIYSDYILEYDENTSETNYIAVEHYKIETTISNDSHGTATDHLHVSDLGSSTDIRLVGIQPGMDAIVTTTHNGIATTIRTSIIKIEKDDSGTWNGWRVYTKHTKADGGVFEALDSVHAGDSVTFELPKNKRALGFSNFASKKPNKLITGINIIDELLFWTDGITEPKKINIERCRYGSQHLNPYQYPNGTNIYYTLLIVNGEVPSPSNGRVSDDNSTYPTGYSYIPLTYKETTVIRKSPTAPLRLTMSNTTRGDLVIDGVINVDCNVTLPSTTNNSSDFFFNLGQRLPYGHITDSLQFDKQLDWQVGDLVEFYPEDDDAGDINSVLVLAEVATVVNGDTFTFIIRTISSEVVQVITQYRVRLKKIDPLFEFKFPRFAYRWKYEDGEYSTYSPFSEVAFIPDAFDYLPKKGFNLGMTNNLRYLMLSGFKPTTTPLDVVEIDILYKESNSPNVYTVETIKSPSVRNESLKTDLHEGDKSWFGKVKLNNNWVESPRTKTEISSLVGTNTFDGTVTINSTTGIYYYGVDKNFTVANMKIGDTVIFPNITSGLAAPVTIHKMANIQNGLQVQTTIALKANGVEVAVAAGAAWHANGVDIELYRQRAKHPAIFVDYPQGSLEIKTDMIHATLPSNQLLRPWDNVPTKALAQEVSGNGVVYGNYTQNYNLLDESGRLVYNNFESSITGRKNVRDNIRYNDATALRNPSDGSVINWYDSLNTIKKAPTYPERSIKSLREYQVGVVYSDEFGRQTPIQTHESGVLKTQKQDALEYGQLRYHLRDADDSTGKKDARFPDWATHYKYYIKENSNEYYNLAMDRFYNAEDGNVWVSFPSSERNKVDEETFLILKKQHDSNVFVSEEARFKIIAIANEAPLFIKTKTNSYGIISPSNYGSSNLGFPKYQQSYVDIPNTFFQANGSYSKLLESTDRVIRISDNTNISKWYEVTTIVEIGGHRRVAVRTPFGTDVSFTTDDGTSSGNYSGNVSVELAEREIKNLAEFEGRFFVKLLKNAALEKNILSKAPAKEYVTSMALKLGYLYESTAGYSILSNNFWKKEVPSKKFFVDEVISEGIHVSDPGSYNNQSSYYNGQGLHSGNNKIDISYHNFEELPGTSHEPPWHIKTAVDTNVSSYDKSISNILLSPGQLFRWKGDTTIYRITNTTSHAVENYWGAENANFYDLASNHREKFRVEFEPSLGSMAGINNTNLDAAGFPITSTYNPFTQNAETGTIIGSDWGNFGESSYDNRSIEFLQEFVADSSYTSDNPAIWETEPKENIDIDLYNEASSSIPINFEWNSFLNRFKYSSQYISDNVIDYYNCFSFANGVESNRVRDDYNATTIDKGPKVSTVLAEQYKQEQRKSGLIYSGIYNSTSGINNLNQFIQAEKITKDLNPTYGSIQKLYSRDTDLVTLCEDRIIKVLANKDAIYNADGNINLTSTNNVLGQATPYGGDYGISTNPESFAVDQYRAYFTDKSRGSVIRLSLDGITPISDVGMRDYFKDAFKQSDIVLLGSYDDNKKLYNITLKSSTSSTASTSTAQTTSNVVINTGHTPTTGNALGNWFRYAEYTSNWSEAVETTSFSMLTANPGGAPSGIIGATGPHQRGWAGIAAGTPNAPTGVEHGKPGVYGANPNLTNPITVYFDKITSGYTFTPAFDSTSNWNSLITALNNNGPNNVYLYQTFIQANYTNILPLPFAFQNWPTNWSYSHQPETVYSIESIDYDSKSGTYKVTLNWLVGLSSYQDSNSFVWSLNSPFEEANVVGEEEEDKDNNVVSEFTLSFSEDTKGWTSFKSWLQETGNSLNDKYFTFKQGNIYQHYTNQTRNNFYGSQYDSSVCVIFNDIPSSVKSFSSLSYEGSKSRVIANTTDGEYYNNTAVEGWFAKSITTDLETGFVPEFKNKEGKWFNYIKGNKANNLANLDVNQFSTQGIGMPSAVTHYAASNNFTKLTTQDTGDTD